MIVGSVHDAVPKRTVWPRTGCSGAAASAETASARSRAAAAPGSCDAFDLLALLVTSLSMWRRPVWRKRPATETRRGMGRFGVSHSPVQRVVRLRWRRGDSNPGPRYDRLQRLRAYPTD